jgi:hypothetical protein
MHLELTDSERDELVLILESVIPELRAEIASTVSYNWHDELKNEEAILNSVLEKLKNLKPYSQ